MLIRCERALAVTLVIASFCAVPATAATVTEYSFNNFKFGNDAELSFAGVPPSSDASKFYATAGSAPSIDAGYGEWVLYRSNSVSQYSPGSRDISLMYTDGGFGPDFISGASGTFTIYATFEVPNPADMVNDMSGGRDTFSLSVTGDGATFDYVKIEVESDMQGGLNVLFVTDVNGQEGSWVNVDDDNLYATGGQFVRLQLEVALATGDVTGKYGVSNNEDSFSLTPFDAGTISLHNYVSGESHFAQVNFQFVNSAPEPGSLGLLGVATLVAAATRRARARRR